MNHALVVGGTGMMEGVSLYLAQKYRVVTVIARNQQKLESLKERSSRINPISSDYSNLDRFLLDVKDSADSFGKVQTCITWIHSPFFVSALELSKYFSSQKETLEYFRVMGLNGIENTFENIKRRESFVNLPYINYHEIILGSINSRWLTNEEISSGIVNALTTPKFRTIVGESKYP